MNINKVRVLIICGLLGMYLPVIAQSKQNHWLHLTFTGLKDAEFIGARVELTADGKKQYRWIHSNHSYKSGGQLDDHFGLGKAATANVTVTLLNGKSRTFEQLPADQYPKLACTSP